MENETIQDKEYQHMGIKIAKIRNILGMNQGELANKMRMSPATISNIENGKTPPSLGFINRFCRMFKIPQSYILDLNANDNPPFSQDYYTDIAMSLSTNELKIRDRDETWYAVNQINKDYDITRLFNSLNSTDKAEVIEFIRFKKSRYAKTIDTNDEFIKNFTNSISETIKKTLYEVNYQNNDDYEK